MKPCPEQGTFWKRSAVSFKEITREKVSRLMIRSTSVLIPIAVLLCMHKSIPIITF